MYRKPTGMGAKLEDAVIHSGCHLIATGLRVATSVADVMQFVRESELRKDIQDLTSVYGECASFLMASIKNGRFVEDYPSSNLTSLNAANLNSELGMESKDAAAE